MRIRDFPANLDGEPPAEHCGFGRRSRQIFLGPDPAGPVEPGTHTVREGAVLRKVELAHREAFRVFQILW